jgi:nitroreductase
MTALELTIDQVLSTTRAVRRRLDLERPVGRDVIEECLALAQQAPRASNLESRTFVVITDAEKRAALADLWRRGMEKYLAAGQRAGSQPSPDPTTRRIRASVAFLGDHLHQVPIHLIPCLSGRVEGRSAVAQASTWGTITPATWSFMLAARSRGLGTCWTTFHLLYEREAAGILGIPYDEVTQTALIPVAYTLGTDFKPAPRESLSSIVRWDGW